MRVVGVKALKDRLSEFLRLVRGGETVLVTDRGAVVAELGPPRADRALRMSDVAMLEDIRRALVSPATRAGPPPDVSGSKPSIDRILRDLREDRGAR